MRFGFRNWDWRRRVAVGVAVVLPCLLWWGMREVISWRPQLLFRGATVVDMKFSPTEPLLACATYDQGAAAVQVWNSDLRKRVWSRDIGTATGPIAFSQDGKWLAGTEIDYRKGSYLTVWDSHTGKRRHSLRDSRILLEKGFQFSPDGQSLVTYGGRGKAYIFNIATGRCIKAVAPPSAYEASHLRILSRPRPFERFRNFLDLQVSPDGKTWVGTLEVWGNRKEFPNRGPEALSQQQWFCDAAGRPQTLLTGARYIAAFSPDSRWLATFSDASPQSLLAVWDTKTRKLGRPLEVPNLSNRGRFGSVGFSQDGNYLYAGVAAQAGHTQPSHTFAIIWDVNSGKIVRTLGIEPNKVIDVILCLSSDKSVMAQTATPFDTQPCKVQLWRAR